MSSERLLAVVVLVASCSVDTDGYRNRLYLCDVTSSDTAACGASFGCYGAARQLGAPDFCAPACDSGTPAPAGEVCTESSLLARCDPAASGGCPAGMNCIRTDLLGDEGVCLPISPCSKNGDCVDPVRSECFSTEMSGIYTRRPDLKTDHLFCEQAGCLAHQEACAPGTSCLPTQLGQGLPDVCTPNCDAKGRCPPNFICSSKFLPSVVNAFCIPGLLGFRCSSNLECVIGQCQAPAGESKKLCSTGCQADADCVPYDNANFFFPAVFSCVGGQCLSPSSFIVEFCKIGHAAADCEAGMDCAPIIPNLPAGLGLCVSPCANGSCPARGGFSQSCVTTASAGPVCIIGVFGIPCTNTDTCVGGLTCRQIVNELPAKLCTTTCATHADCQANRHVGADGYCVSVAFPGEPGVCAPKGENGARCTVDVQCKSGSCSVSGNTGTCVPAGG